MDLARNETISKIGKVDIKEVHSLNYDLGQSGNINRLIIIDPEMQNVVPTMLYFWRKMVNHDASPTAKRALKKVLIIENTVIGTVRLDNSKL